MPVRDIFVDDLLAAGSIHSHCNYPSVVTLSHIFTLITLTEAKQERIHWDWGMLAGRVRAVPLIALSCKYLTTIYSYH